MIRTYARPVNAILLATQLAAAFPAWIVNHEALYQVRVEGGTLYLTCPDTADPVAVDTLVAQHDATALTPEQQQAAADQADMAAFPSRAQVLDALGQITTDLQTLSGALTLAQAGPILQRTVTNQRAIIRALGALVRRASG